MFILRILYLHQQMYTSNICSFQNCVQDPFSVAGIHRVFFGAFKVPGTEDLWFQFVIARWFAQYGWNEKLRALVKRSGRNMEKPQFFFCGGESERRQACFFD